MEQGGVSTETSTQHGEWFPDVQHSGTTLNVSNETRDAASSLTIGRSDAFTSSSPHVRDDMLVSASTTDGDLDPSQRTISLAAQEVRLAQRLVSKLEAEAPPWAWSYFLELQEIYASSKPALDADCVSSGHYWFIANRLRRARGRLLNLAPTVRHWMSLAQVVDPLAPMIIPERFVIHEDSPIEEIDTDALHAAAWVREAVG